MQTSQPSKANHAEPNGEEAAVAYKCSHPGFHDNFAEGSGSTEDGALASMEADMDDLSNSLWAF